MQLQGIRLVGNGDEFAKENVAELLSPKYAKIGVGGAMLQNEGLTSLVPTCTLSPKERNEYNWQTKGVYTHNNGPEISIYMNANKLGLKDETPKMTIISRETPSHLRITKRDFSDDETDHEIVIHESEKDIFEGLAGLIRGAGKIMYDEIPRNPGEEHTYKEIEVNNLPKFVDEFKKQFYEENQ